MLYAFIGMVDGKKQGIHVLKIQPLRNSKTSSQCDVKNLNFHIAPGLPQHHKPHQACAMRRAIIQAAGKQFPLLSPHPSEFVYGKMMSYQIPL